MALMIWFIMVGCFNNYSKGADPDGDGVLWDEDCDDNDASVNPDAVELCNERDDDCDGEVDEGVTTTYYADGDGDGYGDLDAPVEACAETNHLAANAEDCDDTNSTVNTGAAEVWYDGVDQDCDGADDFDQDGDGFQSADHEDLDGKLGTDCDDEHATAYPGGNEICNTGIDEDCSGDDNGCSGFGEVLVGEADYTASGTSDGLFGHALTSGDWNNDGAMDLAVSAYRATNSDGIVNAGQVYVFYGPIPMTLSVADADAVFEGVDAEDYFGVAIDGSGDLDGDGFADLLMTSHHHSSGGYTRNGLLTVMLGDETWAGTRKMNQADVQIFGDAHSGNFGEAARFVSDISGDGYDDIAIGANLSRDGGTVHIIPGGKGYEGQVQNIDQTAELAILGTKGDKLGGEYSIGGAFDLDGDGFGDFAFGDSLSSNGSLIYLLYGPYPYTHPGGSKPTVYISALDLSSARILPDATDDYIGHGTGTPGDVDNDGYDDLMIGAKNYVNSPPYNGQVYLISGDSAPLSGEHSLRTLTVATVTGAMEKDALGVMINGGDINHDGVDDVLLSAPGYEFDDAETSGAAYVFYGPLSGTLTTADADLVFPGPSAGSEMGISATVFDADGDANGLMEAFFGARQAGMVYGYFSDGL